MKDPLLGFLDHTRMVGVGGRLALDRSPLRSRGLQSLFPGVRRRRVSRTPGGPGKGPRLVFDEDYAFGLVDETDRPRWDLVRRMREANLAAPHGRLDAMEQGAHRGGPDQHGHTHRHSEETQPENNADGVQR